MTRRKGWASLMSDQIEGRAGGLGSPYGGSQSSGETWRGEGC